MPFASLDDPNCIERKQAEETTHESAAWLRLVMEQMPAVLWTTDTQLRFTSSTGTGLTALNLRADQVVGTTLFESFQTYDADFLPIAAHCRALSGESVTYEIVWGERAFSAYVEPLRDENGRIIGTIGIALDITERKQVEESLRQSEATNRALLSALPDMMFRMRRDGTYLEFKPSKEIAPLLPPSEFIGKKVSEVMPADIARQAMYHIERAFETGAMQVIEYQLSMNGELRDYEGRIVVSGEDEVLAIVRDITRRKQTEKALRTSEERLRAIVGYTPNVAIEGCDLNGRVLFWNKAAEKIFGWTQQEVLGKTLDQLILDADSAQEFCSILQAVKQHDIPFGPSEWSCRRKDGQEITVYSTIFAIPSVGGSNEFICMDVDITERRQAEDALQASEKRFRALIEHSSDGIALIDGDGTILYAGPSTSRIMGYSAEELVGRNGFELVHPDDREHTMNLLTELLQKPGEIVTVQCRIRHKDGSWQWIEAVGNNLLAEPSVQAIVVNYRDISEKRKMEAELLKVEKLESVGVLAGGLAHDFNNILTAILGNVSLAMMCADRDGEVYGILEEAEKACLRARDLTQQLLTFAKGGAPILQITSIADILQESTRFALTGSNVRCEFSIPDDLWAVVVDEGQMSQVIHNLVINAQQAMPRGGTVKVRAENVLINFARSLPLTPGGYVKVSIEDEGMGIPEEHLPKIFDPFFTTKQKGSGLGLASAYSVVNSHKGYMTVESALGKGTIFHIYLLASADSVTSRQQTETVSAVGQGKILIMDDEEVIRNVSKDILSRMGYVVECVCDGTEAIEKYRNAHAVGQPFDVVIMDLTVPGGMGGKEAMQSLLEVNPRAKVIVSSGYSNDPIMSEYPKYGFCDVLAKPYKFADLQRVLHRVATNR